MISEEQAEMWYRKGKFWGRLGTVLLVPVLAAIPVQFAVEDEAWSRVILGVAVALVAAQIAAFVRMNACYRRAGGERRVRRAMPS